HGEVRHEVAAQPVFDVEAGSRDVRRPVDGVRPHAADGVRLDDEEPAAADPLEVRQLAALRDALEAVDAKVRPPEILLVLPANEAAEVDAERRVGRGLEIQGRERDGDRRGPAVRGYPRLGAPDAVPVRVVDLALVADERVELRAERIDG